MGTSTFRLLCFRISQHSTAAADVRVVLCGAGITAHQARPLVQAGSAESRILDRRTGARVLYLGPFGRVISGRAASRSARAEDGRRRNRHESSAGLALHRHASGDEDHPATAHLGIFVHRQELVVGLDHRRARTDGAEPAFHGFEAFGAATAFYILVALVLNLVMVRLQRTLALPVAA
jgi:hypothetical protein